MIKMTTNSKKKVELLAPAGNMEKMLTAFHFGADAVYLSGKSFGLRAFADNFDRQQLKQAVDYAHSYGKKVYVTVNIFASNDDFDELKDYLVYLQSIKVDAIIASDLGVISFSKNVAPNLPIHVSTQANILNKHAVKFLHEFGAERVVLARECKIEDIAKINEFVPTCETEVFVHGAMCISYSGRCLMSNYLTGRDANRGECVQSCRWSWQIKEKEKEHEPFEVREDNRGTYIFNSKDLNLLSRIPKLIESGIASFKIEGRMKSPYYVATTINAYRHAIDAYYDGKFNDELVEYLKQDLCKTTHRQFTEGFAFDDGEVRQNYESSRAVGDSEFLAVVKEYNDGVATVEMRSRFTEGQTVEILARGDAFNKKVVVKNLRDTKDQPVMDAKIVQQLLRFDCPFKLEPYDILRTV